MDLYQLGAGSSKLERVADQERVFGCMVLDPNAHKTRLGKHGTLSGGSQKKIVGAAISVDVDVGWPVLRRIRRRGDTESKHLSVLIVHGSVGRRSRDAGDYVVDGRNGYPSSALPPVH